MVKYCVDISMYTDVKIRKHSGGRGREGGYYPQWGDSAEQAAVSGDRRQARN